jgi:hypothetical protein
VVSEQGWLALRPLLQRGLEGNVEALRTNFVMTKSGAVRLLLCEWRRAGRHGILAGVFDGRMAGLGRRGTENHGPNGVDLWLVTGLKADSPYAGLFEPRIPQFILCA